MHFGVIQTMSNIYRLSEANIGQETLVVGFDETVNVPEEWKDWLEEIGLSEGEPCVVVRRTPTGFPMAVRIGVSTFALRKAEAECILVQNK